MTPRDLIDDLRRRINPAYAAKIGTESWERRLCAEALEAQADELERLRAENAMLRQGDTCARMCEGTAYRIEARQQKHRADVLAATVRDLRDVVTDDAETKAEFIARVCAILAADPDARVTPNDTGNGPSGVAAKVRVD